MSGFEQHGIKHSSASAINMYCNAPCAWVARYLFNAKFSFANAARAGVLVEDAVVSVIAAGVDAEKAIKDAKKEYSKATALYASAADKRRGDAMEGMINLALEELAPYGDPEFDENLIRGSQQKKIELTCNGDGWKLPIIGYLDFYFPKEGLVVDLKTTMAAPNRMSVEHIRQGSIYRQAMGNCGVKFLYVTGKKAVWHEIEEPKEVLEDIKTILNRQERLLRLDKEKIKDIIPVSAGSYYWNGDERLRQEFYGI